MPHRLPLSELLLATTSEDKIREFREFFIGSGIRIDAPLELGIVLMPVEEDQPSLAANASLKASRGAKETGRWVLADDTGLQVDALGGQPGVRTARYAGPSASMDENRSLLLNRLSLVPPLQRTADFVCSLAIAGPDGEIHAQVEGRCSGMILHSPAGAGGFGYDSLFHVPGAGCTMAQFTASQRREWSHRARAVDALLRWIESGVPG